MDETKKVMSAAEVRGLIQMYSQNPDLLTASQPQEDEYRPRRNTKTLRRNTRTIRRNTKTIRRDLNATGMPANDLLALLDSKAPLPGVPAAPSAQAADPANPADPADPAPVPAGGIIRPAPRSMNSTGMKPADLLSVLGSGPLTDVASGGSASAEPAGRPRKNTRMMRRAMNGNGMSRDELLAALDLGADQGAGVAKSSDEPQRQTQPEGTSAQPMPAQHKNPLVRMLLTHTDDYNYAFETTDGTVYLGVANECCLRVTQNAAGQVETLLYRHIFFVEKEICNEIKGRTIAMESPTWILGEEIETQPLRVELHPILFGREGVRKIRYQLKGEEVKRIKIFGDEEAQLPGGLICGHAVARVLKGIPRGKIQERSAV